MEQETSIIYGLCDPRTNQLRYIGATKNLKYRISKHKTDSCKLNTHLGHWIKSLKAMGTEPDCFIVEEVSRNDWVTAERFWISYFRFIGANLTNETDGGEGIVNPSRECRERRSASLMGHVISEETKEKIRIGNTGKKMSDSARSKMSAFRKGKKFALGFKHTEETRKKMGDARRGKKQSKECVEKRARSLTGKHRTEEQKVALRASHNTPQSRERASAARKLWWQRKWAAENRDTQNVADKICQTI